MLLVTRTPQPRIKPIEDTPAPEAPEALQDPPDLDDVADLDEVADSVDVDDLDEPADRHDDVRGDTAAGEAAVSVRALSSRALLRRTTTWLAALVVVLALAVAALAVGWHHSAKQADAMRQQDTLSASALAAAQEYAVDLTSYNYAQLAAQQTKLAGESTPKFQTTFASSMKSLGPIFTKLHATASGKILDAAVVSATPTQATVIAFLDQTANSTQMSKPQVQSSRVRLSLVRQGDVWLLDRVDLV